MTRTPTRTWFYGLLCAVSLLCLDATWSRAAEIKDHALISRYPGSVPGWREHRDFDSYQLITSVPKGSWKPAGETIQGTVTRIGYNNPRGRSVLEIFSNYQQALLSAGFEVVFKCAAAACGPGWASSSWGRFNGMRTASGNQKHYLAVKLATADQLTYVAVLVNRHRSQIDVVETKAMETGLVVINADTLAERIRRHGRVSVPGIYFDHDKATIKAKSKAALDEVAKLLKKQPKLDVYVVGHTDGVGGFQHNMRLSSARATSVVSELAAAYGIRDKRLSAHGVGPLAPAAANANDSGRAKNRRVELVAR